MGDEPTEDLTDAEQAEMVEQTDNRLTPEDETFPQPGQGPDDVVAGPDDEAA